MGRLIGKVFILICLTYSTGWASVTKIEPANWWVGFNNPHLQLMVYGKDITLLTPEISYPGVSIETITRAQSPNYLFVDLIIDRATQPGRFDIRFLDARKKVVSVSPYELKKRRDGSASRKSFDTSDVMYLLFPDRFANGDPANDQLPGMLDTINRNDQYGRRGGDIQGIIDHLAYLKELGITTIWTTPLLEDNQPQGSYHHYATTDFYRVDPRFGTNDDYLNLVETCHRQGIKVVMDMIPNHCGSAHPWMSDLPFEDWINGGTHYVQTNYRIPTTNDPYVSAYDHHLNFNGWFVSEMPDMNQNNPFLLTYLKQFAIWWVEFSGLDGIRVDTYPYNEPQKAAEWTRAIRTEFPGINIVGECWMHSPSEVAYWQSGTANHDGYNSFLPSVMDFSMHDAISVAFNEDNQGWDRGTGQLWYTLARDYFYANPFNLVIFTENHDTQRFSTVVNHDIKKYKLGLTFLLTTRGIPQLYYGSEIMMGGDKGIGDGDIRREMPGGWSNHTRSVFTREGRDSIENEIFDYVKTLIHWRNQNPVIHSGRLLHFVPENNVYTYFRINDQKTVMVVINNHPEKQTIDPRRFKEGIANFGLGTDITSGRQYSLTEPFGLEGKTALVMELGKLE